MFAKIFCVKLLFDTNGIGYGSLVESNNLNVNVVNGFSLSVDYPKRKLSEERAIHMRRRK